MRRYHINCFAPHKYNAQLEAITNVEATFHDYIKAGLVDRRRSYQHQNQPSSSAPKCIGFSKQ